MNKSRNLIGVSFIELLVAIILLAIVAIFLAMSIPTSIGLSGKTNNMEDTTAIAQKYIEAVKSLYGTNPDDASFASLDELDIDECTIIPPITISSIYTGNNKYSTTTEMCLLNTATINEEVVPSLFTLKVNVSPKDAEGHIINDSKQAVSVSTMLRRDR